MLNVQFDGGTVGMYCACRVVRTTTRGDVSDKYTYDVSRAAAEHFGSVI